MILWDHLLRGRGAGRPRPFRSCNKVNEHPLHPGGRVTWIPPSWACSLSEVGYYVIPVTLIGRTYPAIRTNVLRSAALGGTAVVLWTTSRSFSLVASLVCPCVGTIFLRERKAYFNLREREAGVNLREREADVNLREREHSSARGLGTCLVLTILVHAG